VIMDANVALSDLASCGTRQIWAKLSGRVHWLFGCLLHTPKMRIPSGKMLLKLVWFPQIRMLLRECQHVDRRPNDHQ
jgi:hypothetical protein